MGVKRILAVENNELVLSFLEAGLANAGYHVDIATNGLEALQKIDRVRYDVIISDVHMPEMDGVALCRALGERQADALRRVVLLLTGWDSLEDHDSFLSQAGVRALIKPVDLEELRD